MTATPAITAHPQGPPSAHPEPRQPGGTGRTNGTGPAIHVLTDEPDDDLHRTDRSDIPPWP